MHVYICTVGAVISTILTSFVHEINSDIFMISGNMATKALASCTTAPTIALVLRWLQLVLLNIWEAGEDSVL